MNHVIVSTKGGVGKTTISSNILPCLLKDIELSKINVFEIDNNNTTKVDKSEMNFYHVNLKDLSNVLVDIELNDGLNIIDCGDDTIDVIKGLKQDEIEVKRFYIPITHDFEVIENVKITINSIRKYYPDVEIFLILNKIFDLSNKDSIKKQFMFLYGSDEYVVDVAKDIFKEVSQILVIPEESNVFALVKNIYDTTIRDLLEKGTPILNNIETHNREWKKEASKIKTEKGIEEARKYLDDKKRKLRLLKKIKETCELLRKENKFYI